MTIPKKTLLMNMVMLTNEKGEVLVLYKKKKYGWEGLTFPGGKIESEESFSDSCRREFLEETGLTLGAVTLCGTISWVFVDDPDERQVGLLYKADSYSGDLKPDSDEGHCEWIDFETFLEMPEKSDSMEEMLRIYQGEASEVYIRYEGDQKLDSTFF